MGMDETFEPEQGKPAEPDNLRRRRVSNGLYQLADDAKRLEDDFAYQYGYNQEVVESLAEKTRDKEALEERLRRAEQLVGELRGGKPQKKSRRLSLLGWFLAVTLGSVLTYDKTVEPIDKLLKRVTIMLCND